MEVDERVLRQEPKGRFAPSLAGTHEAVLAGRFFEAVRAGDERVLCSLLKGVYPYPGKAGERTNAEVRAQQHKHTLTYALHATKLNSSPASRIRQQASRPMNAGNVLVHMGDLEVSESARQWGGGVGGGGMARIEGARTVRGKRRNVLHADEDETMEDQDEDENEEMEWVPAAKRARRV